MTLTCQRAFEVLDYFEEEGILSWKEGTYAHARQKNGQAGTFNGKGYRIIKVDGSWYMVHRVLWLMHYEVWPSEQIDHIDGDKNNNKISNLRDVTGSVNCHNQGVRVSNTTGYTGVELRDSGRWRASVTINRQRIGLGTFNTYQEASEAVATAKAPFAPEYMSAA